MKPMTKSMFAALAIVFATLMVTYPIEGQQRYSSRVSGVRVDVLVTDSSRRVAGLKADDFELRDNGVVQEIRAIEVERVRT